MFTRSDLPDATVATVAERPDTSELRELSVEFGCDPRSIIAEFEVDAGLRAAHVRGRAGRVARAAKRAWHERQTRPAEPAR